MRGGRVASFLKVGHAATVVVAFERGVDGGAFAVILNPGDGLGAVVSVVGEDIGRGSDGGADRSDDGPELLFVVGSLGGWH